MLIDILGRVDSERRIFIDRGYLILAAKKGHVAKVLLQNGADGMLSTKMTGRTSSLRWGLWLKTDTSIAHFNSFALVLRLGIMQSKRT